MEQIELEKLIKEEMKGFPGKFALYAEDENGSKLEIQADQSWETASCIKVAVLLELFRRVSGGEISLEKKLPFNPKNHTLGSGILRHLTPGLELSIQDIATLMIIISDNVATNILIDLLGINAINSTADNLGLKQTRLLNKIYFSGETPTLIGETTCREYIQMFKLIKNNVFGREASEKIWDILQTQQFNGMLTRFLPISMLQSASPEESPEISVGSKSGSLENCRNDGGVVFTPLGHYYIAVFTKDFPDPYYYNDHIAHQWAPRINKILFHHFLARGGSF